MKVCIDIETNSLINPTKIWVVVCKDIDTDIYHIFRNLTTDDTERKRFNDFRSNQSIHWIGHNFLGYDYPVLLDHNLLSDPDIASHCTDTLIISKLVDYPRQGHSIEDYGIEFNLPKIKFNNYKEYSLDLENYCIRDVDICHKIYSKYLRYIEDIKHTSSILLEHRFQFIVNDLSTNGFFFNINKGTELLRRIQRDLSILDKDILETFVPKLKYIRTIVPKETKYGTISLTSIPKQMRGDIADLNIAAPFCYCAWHNFNPSSHKQIIEVLNEAKWSPVDKTQTHIETERELSKLRYIKRTPELDIRLQELYTKLEIMKKSGYKINENNLDTLPLTAPSSARTLAKRILLESRRRTLTEWLNLVWHEIEIERTLGTEVGTKEKPQIQNGSQRKEVREENTNSLMQIKSERIINEITSNIPTVFQWKTLLEWLKSKKVDVQSAKENENSMWITVIGQDQLEKCCAQLATATWAGTKNIPLKYKIISSRIHGRFNGLGAWSHRMNHQAPNTANIPNEFDTQGKRKLYGKELRSLWCAPKNRLLVGVDAEGIQLRIFAHLIDDPEFTRALVEGKKENASDPHSLNQKILGQVCKSRAAAKRYIYALLLGAGQGKLREILNCSEQDARQAYERLLSRYAGFAALKQTRIPADAKRGWFTGLDGRLVRIPGDTVSQRRHLAMSGYLQNGEAIVMKQATLLFHDKLKEYDALLVNLVHDEWQVECPNDMTKAITIAAIMATSLNTVGEKLGLKCPLAGSYWNDDLKGLYYCTTGIGKLEPD